jgi:hypothetical protein
MFCWGFFLLTHAGAHELGFAFLVLHISATVFLVSSRSALRRRPACFPRQGVEPIAARFP